jgi:hypothetical protein
MGRPSSIFMMALTVSGRHSRVCVSLRLKVSCVFPFVKPDENQVDMVLAHTTFCICAVSATSLPPAQAFSMPGVVRNSGAFSLPDTCGLGRRGAGLLPAPWEQGHAGDGHRLAHVLAMGKASPEALSDIVIADIGDTEDERLWVPQVCLLRVLACVGA